MIAQGQPRHRLDRWLLLLAAVLAIGGAAMLILLNRELSQTKAMFIDDLPSYSVRAEFDLSMLVSEINEYLIDPADPEEMQLRFEILMARFNHYESAFFEEFQQVDLRFRNIIESQKQKLLDLEDPFYSLRADDSIGAARLKAELKAMRYPLAELSDLTRHNQFLQYQTIDESLSRSFRVGVLMLASTFILGILILARYGYNLRQKTRFNTALEETIQARTRDLQSSNTALQREISERQFAEKRLAERERQMHRARRMESIGRTTAGVAHDFNNLLAVIMGNIELLATRVQDPESRRFLDNALSATNIGSQLTRKLLVFGRRSSLKPEVVDANHVISELKELFAQTISAKNTLVLKLDPEALAIKVDRSLLENVLINLLINASDALPDGGVITVETLGVTVDRDQVSEQGHPLTAGHHTRIIVSDPGKGMSPEVLDQAIEPFFTTKPESEGSGLGLSMTYGFVQQSNGQLRVSSSPGQGTSVSLQFPSSREQIQPGESEQQMETRFESAARTRRILVTEDSDAVRITVVEQLALMGYETIEACNGQQALELLSRHSPIDMLLTDVVMPGSLQGPQLAEKALEQYPDLKIVFMSGFPKGMEQHATDGFTKLMKPVSLAMLSQTLQQEFSGETPR